MRTLVIGQGGREHALCWKLARSPSVERVFCAPGNSGTALEGKNVAISDDDPRELIRFCKKESIGLVVIGPEAPLVAGLSDQLRKAEIPVFGPSKGAAALEGSKIFCKQILRAARAPTADFHIFDDVTDVDHYLFAHPGPSVVKADGLAAGKGVIVCENVVEARAAARRMLVDREFGAAGDKILVEERLVGKEVSLLAITDGTTILPLEPCQDHKRVGDGDTGPNTGGMGAYCPASILTPELLDVVLRDILTPVIHEMQRVGCPFSGVLYAGLMLTASGPKVLEFNVRFGDPECQPLLVRLKNDLGEVLLAAATGKLGKIKLEWDPRPAVCVVMASAGYPGSYKKGFPITGLDTAGSMEDVVVFHAGAEGDKDHVVTNGGRVLGVTALATSMREAKERAMSAVSQIHFAGAIHRLDIANQAIL